MNVDHLLFLTQLPIALLCVVIVALSQLWWLTTWQLKEYRFDRMRDFFSTVSGRASLFNLRISFELLPLIALSLLPWLHESWWLFTIALPLLLVDAALWWLCRLKPVWTLKARLIALASLLTSIALAAAIILLGVPVVTACFIAVCSAPLVVAAWVVIMMPIAAWQKRRIISRAKLKLQRLQPVVIGITGSYGKSTTKQYLHTLLEGLEGVDPAQSVFSTPKNINTDIGIAQVLLQQLTDQHRICIIEMGAYRIGEIKSICELVQPQIGILTAISQQHLSLFGSLEHIQAAKAELLQSLPATGTAIINGDQETCRAVASLSPAPVLYYSTATDQADVWADQIVAEPNQISFTLHLGGQAWPVIAPLHGRQVVGQILAAAAAAHVLGLPADTIARRISALTPSTGTMSLAQHTSGAVIIDDHYNSSPAAFQAALDYLELFREQKKIVITPGMYELGTESPHHHRLIGEQIARCADQLIITKPDFASDLMAGAVAAGLPESAIQLEVRPDHIIPLLSSLSKSDVVLLEGRVHSSIVRHLIP